MGNGKEGYVRDSNRLEFVKIDQTIATDTKDVLPEMNNSTSKV